MAGNDDKVGLLEGLGLLDTLETRGGTEVGKWGDCYSRAGLLV